MDVKELKACPFCGKAAARFLWGQSEGPKPFRARVKIFCENCGVEGPWCDRSSELYATVDKAERGAASLWNERAA